MSHGMAWHGIVWIMSLIARPFIGRRLQLLIIGHVICIYVICVENVFRANFRMYDLHAIYHEIPQNINTVTDWISNILFVKLIICNDSSSNNNNNNSYIYVMSSLSMTSKAMFNRTTSAAIYIIVDCSASNKFVYFVWKSFDFGVEQTFYYFV